jgi:hypothetical protein
MASRRGMEVTPPAIDFSLPYWRGGPAGQAEVELLTRQRPTQVKITRR